MQQKLDKLYFLTGQAEMIENAFQTPALETWAERTVEFFSNFSQNLMADKRSRRFEDIMSYAFWIRRASLSQIKEHYYADVEGKLGRGVAFHIAPSNVPINFAVSFTSSLLAGNINIVRVSNKDYEQVDIITGALKKTFADGFDEMEKYIILIRYEHDDDITKYLSSICDLRIIWGGDKTIERIRKAPLPPRAIEMTFADRHSLAVLNVNSVQSADITKLAEGFYTDTYYTDQNACSSPRIVVWMGDEEKVSEYKEIFWNEVEKLTKKKYDLQPIQAIDKLEQLCLLAANRSEELGAKREGESNRVVRVSVDKLDSELMNYKFGGGYFFEYVASSFDDLLPIMGKQCQTLAYFGFDAKEIKEFIIKQGIRGVDRVVPIGKTMDLTFKWDGYDMIQNMSRWVYAPEYKL